MGVWRRSAPQVVHVFHGVTLAFLRHATVEQRRVLAKPVLRGLDAGRLLSCTSCTRLNVRGPRCTWYEDCIADCMGVTPSGQAVTHEALSASLRVVEGAIALARAETKLAVIRLRELATQAVVLVLGGLMAITFLALTLVIVSLAPLTAAPSTSFHVATSVPLPWPFLLSLTASAGITVAGIWVALAAFRRLKSLSSNEDGDRT
jgi:hypothetical protein